MSQDRQDRRDFTRTVLAGGAAWMFGGGPGCASSCTADEQLAAARPVHAAPGNRDGDILRLARHRLTRGSFAADGRTFREAAREVPVSDSADVVVCGGGPAGIAAALAAARAGAKTRLIEVAGCVGGIWTAGALSLIIDWQNKTGIMQELAARLMRRNAAHRLRSNALVYDPESMKALLEQMLDEAGVALRLHTRVVAAVVDDGNRLAAVLTESKSGREAWLGRCFVDCTGDGDVAALAGCPFKLGRPGDGTTQPMSLMALLCGPPLDAIARFVNGVAESRKLGRAKTNLLAEMRRAGVDPSYGLPTLFCIRDGFYALMANHQYGVLATDAADVTRATVEARREVHRIVAALRSLGGCWRSLQLVATAEHIGTREGRRIVGRYRLTMDDLARGAHFPDAVCRVTFGIDVHSTDPNKSKGIEAKPVRSKPYDIPLRALIARDVDGLMMAGRCISGDFLAHSSYRVTGNAVAMGEAAGRVAAIAARTDRLPHQIGIDEWKLPEKQLREERSFE